MVVGKGGRGGADETAGRAQREGLAAKLRLTAAALGCTTRKDLCGRFLAVNPATEFDLERSYKWGQGRALPRSAQVYADWARVIGTARPPDWLVHCSVAEFLEEMRAIRGIAPAELLRRARMDGPEGDRPDGGRAADPGLGPGRYLAGAYACYSFAWSGYFRGKLIRGGLVVEPGRGAAAPTATYSETLPVGRCRLRGPVQLEGRSVFLDLREPASRLPLFFTLYMPAPPASVLAGLMAGATLVGPDPEPSVSRIVLVKVPAGPALLEDTNRYLDADGDALELDLAGLGLGLGPAGAGIGAAVVGFLSAGRRQAGLDQVLREEASPLIAALDRLYVAGAAGAAEPPAGSAAPGEGEP